MLNRFLGFLAPYAIPAGIVLIALLAFTGWMLRQEIEKNGKLQEQVASLQATIEENRKLNIKREIIIEQDTQQALRDAATLDEYKGRGKKVQDYFATSATGENICFTEEDVQQLQTLWN